MCNAVFFPLNLKSILRKGPTQKFASNRGSSLAGLLFPKQQKFDAKKTNSPNTNKWPSKYGNLHRNHNLEKLRGYPGALGFPQLRKLQQTPKGTYRKDNRKNAKTRRFMAGKSFHICILGCLGLFQGSVGIFLDTILTSGIQPKQLGAVSPTKPLQTEVVTHSTGRDNNCENRGEKNWPAVTRIYLK